MKRLASLGSWKRLGLQAGLLSGLGLAFVSAPEPVAQAGEDCVEEGECSFVKPNMMIIVDYSASMNTDFGVSGTRWDATVSAIAAMIDSDNGYLGNNLNLALMRFGHDENTNQAGTLISNDNSVPPITDGQALDVEWYDTSGGPVDYIECNGEAIKSAILGVDAPVGGDATGIGTWTKGAMDRAAGIIDQSRADHSEQLEDRTYINLVLTDGAYSGSDGIGANTVAGDNPAITATTLWDDDAVPTYVVAVAEGADLDKANELAAAGGTGMAIDGTTPQLMVDALVLVVDTIIAEIVAPECVGGMPRIMVLLDASSSMLNVNDAYANVQGISGWDLAGAALSAEGASLFDLQVASGDTVEDLSQLGLAVFGHDAPDESAVLVDYGPCTRDNFAWALDPNNSCVAPGCTDPWGGPQIDWTVQDGSLQDPFFDVTTISHMPACDLFAFPNDNKCIGSGTYTHLGLNLIANNQAVYHANAEMPGAEFPANASTEYFNILITDGNYSSTDNQVQTALENMETGGMTTYVIGFGEFAGFQAQLDNMASWGSNGVNTTAFTASNPEELEAQLQLIIDGLTFDPCCGFNDCSFTPEPTTDEPDPVGDGDGDGDGDATTGDGDGDGTSGTATATDSTGDGDGDTTSETGDGGEVGAEDGCNCDASRDSNGGFLGFFGLGLLGLMRRRRRD